MYLITDGMGWSIDDLKIFVLKEPREVHGSNICEQIEEREGYEPWLVVETYREGGDGDLTDCAMIEYYPSDVVPKELKEGEFKPSNPYGFRSGEVFDRRKVFFWIQSYR